MIELICGDCLDVMRGMADKSVDAVITDPPYGVGELWVGGGGSGWKATKNRPQERYEWDNKPPPPVYFDEILRIAKTIVIWGGNYFELPTSRGWLIWTKPERGFSLSEAELAWTNLEIPMRVYDCHRSDSDRQHPTQKPLSLMKWCMEIAKLPKGATILDPFAGSGTTGVAAHQTGRNAILIEKDPGYFAIMQKRIHDAEQQPILPLKF